MTRVRASHEVAPPRVAGLSRMGAERARFAEDVREHLSRSPRQLPTRYLYDDLGSALFEAICRLPWYRVTRAEERLLLQARDDIARLTAPLGTVIELGPGSGAKLRRLLASPALDGASIDIHLVDLSRSALDTASYVLAEITGLT